MLFQGRAGTSRTVCERRISQLLDRFYTVATFPAAIFINRHGVLLIQVRVAPGHLYEAIGKAFKGAERTVNADLVKGTQSVRI